MSTPFQVVSVEETLRRMLEQIKLRGRTDANISLALSDALIPLTEEVIRLRNENAALKRINDANAKESKDAK